MADGHAFLSSAELFETDSCKLDLEAIKLQKDCPDLVYDGKRMKWVNTFESLKKYIKETIGIRGKWTSPGGNSKKFSSSNLDMTVTWYNKKQNTSLFKGKDGNTLKELLLSKTTRQTSVSPTVEAVRIYFKINK